VHLAGKKVGADCWSKVRLFGSGWTLLALCCLLLVLVNMPLRIVNPCCSGFPVSVRVKMSKLLTLSFNRLTQFIRKMAVKHCMCSKCKIQRSEIIQDEITEFPFAILAEVVVAVVLR